MSTQAPQTSAPAGPMNLAEAANALEGILPVDGEQSPEETQLSESEEDESFLTTFLGAALAAGLLDEASDLAEALELARARFLSWTFSTEEELDSESDEETCFFATFVCFAIVMCFVL